MNSLNDLNGWNWLPNDNDARRNHEENGDWRADLCTLEVTKQKGVPSYGSFQPFGFAADVCLRRVRAGEENDTVRPSQFRTGHG
jgi:hypothetical protein